MLRCKACDAPLSQFTMTVRKSENLPEPEDLCQKCKTVSYFADSLDVSDYAYAHITENWNNFRVYKENT